LRPSEFGCRLFCMGSVEINDVVIWAKGVHDAALQKRIIGAPPDTIIRLEIGGFACDWIKMRDDPSGRSTNGIRPTKASLELWREIKKQNWRTLMPVRLLAGVPGGDFTLSSSQQAWASKRGRGASRAEQKRLLVAQMGRCALSGVELLFDVEERKAKKKGPGCHPLSPAVDHKDPGNPKGGYQIICYALNDLKGHLPTECFEALCCTDAWKKLMQNWRGQASKNRNDRGAFGRLLRPNAAPRGGSKTRRL